MAHRLDHEIYKMYNVILEEISSMKAKTQAKQKPVNHTIMATSRDEAVRARHKHRALAKLLVRDGYIVNFLPESDEMPKGKPYDKALPIVMSVTWEVTPDVEEE